MFLKIKDVFSILTKLLAAKLNQKWYIEQVSEN
jgi:hypothetical protein